MPRRRRDTSSRPTQPPPPRCHRELVRFWDEDEGAYIERPRRVCDRY